MVQSRVHRARATHLPTQLTPPCPHPTSAAHDPAASRAPVVNKSATTLVALPLCLLFGYLRFGGMDAWVSSTSTPAVVAAGAFTAPPLAWWPEWAFTLIFCGDLILDMAEFKTMDFLLKVSVHTRRRSCWGSRERRSCAKKLRDGWRQVEAGGGRWTLLYISNL